MSPQSLGWSIVGSAYSTYAAGYLSSSGSNVIPFADNPNDGSLDRAAIKWERVITLNQVGLVPVSFYIDLAAMATAVNAGSSAYLDTLVDYGGAWHTIESLPLSSGGLWRTAHYTVTAPANISAVAFAARGPAGEGAYLGRAYVYGAAALAMRCDNSWPAAMSSAYGTPAKPPSAGIGPGGYAIVQPVNKPCPPPLTVPNNFWGPLLAGLTQFMDGLTAMWPGHDSPWLVSAADAFTSAPFMAFASVAFTIWDFRPLVAVISLMLTLEGIRIGLIIYFIIKRSIPFMG